MFLILISCNNSILPGRFCFTDKLLCVSPPASRPRPPQSSRSIPMQGTLSTWTFANRCAILSPSRDAVSFSIHFPIKGSFKSAKCRRSSALDSTPRTFPRFRCRFDSDRPLHNPQQLTPQPSFSTFSKTNLILLQDFINLDFSDLLTVTGGSDKIASNRRHQYGRLCAKARRNSA